MSKTEQVIEVRQALRNKKILACTTEPKKRS